MFHIMSPEHLICQIVLRESSPTSAVNPLDVGNSKSAKKAAVAATAERSTREFSVPKEFVCVFRPVLESTRTAREECSRLAAERGRRARDSH